MACPQRFQKMVQFSWFGRSCMLAILVCGAVAAQFLLMQACLAPGSFHLLHSHRHPCPAVLAASQQQVNPGSDSLPLPAPCRPPPLEQSEGPVAPAAAQQLVKPWLVVCVATTPRQSVNYLNATLAKLTLELPSDPRDPFYGKLQVVVMNVAGKYHDHFERVREELAETHLAKFVDFLNLSDSSPDPGCPPTAAGPNVPSTRECKLTRDIVGTYRAAAGRGKYLTFLEDDMELCPFGLQTLTYLLRKATLYNKDWFAVRTSFGMNGIFLHDKDVLPLADYMLKHQQRRPPDHLAVEWFLGEHPDAASYRGNRRHMSYRYNLFYHSGTVSSLSHNFVQARFPTCYAELMPPVIFDTEAFDSRNCSVDDLSPCPADKGAAAGSLAQWPVMLPWNGNLGIFCGKSWASRCEDCPGRVGSGNCNGDCVWEVGYCHRKRA